MWMSLSVCVWNFLFFSAFFKKENQLYFPLWLDIWSWNRQMLIKMIPFAVVPFRILPIQKAHQFQFVFLLSTRCIFYKTKKSNVEFTRRKKMKIPSLLWLVCVQKKTVFRFPRFFSFSWFFFSFLKEIYNPITMFSLFEILFVVFSCSVRRTQFDVRLIEKKSTWLLAEDFYFACYFEYRCYNWREETENTAVPFGNKFFVFMHVTNTRAIFFFGQYAHLATTWYTLTHAQAYTV